MPLKETEVSYVPSTFDDDDYYGGPGWTGSYDLYTETVVRIETSAYSLLDDRLVWSAISKTVDPDSVREGIDDVTKVTAAEMQKQRVVAGSPRPGGA